MIPVVNCRGDLLAHGNEIFKAISEVGFVYLTNFGIDENEVLRVFKVGKQFFNLDQSIKNQFARSKDYAVNGNSGYVAPNVEILNPTSSAELREAFNYRPFDYCEKYPVDSTVENFHSTLNKLSKSCFGISLKVLSIFAEHLKLEVRSDSFIETFQRVEPGTVRCGEHSDYGSITLLFQDDVGGLEVLGRNGEFVKAEPVAGAVLINTGDLMQRWSSDRVVAVRHRVLIPDNEKMWKSERYSLAYFVHPDDDVDVEPLDGSKKYDSVKSLDYLLNKFKTSY